ncbi:hypothetical protein HPB47_005151 [Ixodes persulcatus]|uniref:Uncharacterized protein n=1 Tax=Ixodes persulcatus TaxID=34615 RepID=A0AC60PE00_IXOPE|nr:hypothetical protein HPB47_005151 [Ixodes persulcatus]
MREVSARIRHIRSDCIVFAVHSYTVQKKIKVVEWLRRNGKNVHLTARQFKLDHKRTREWEKHYEVLLNQNFDEQRSKEVDDALTKYLERERSAGRAVSNRRLSRKALKIASQLQLGNFAPSSQYLKRRKQRFNLSMRQVTSDIQKVPEDCADAAKAFRTALGCLRSCQKCTLHNMTSMDQTMVRMDTLVNRTNNLAVASTLRIANTGCARQGFTVALAVCASGRKLPAFVILK